MRNKIAIISCVLLLFAAPLFAQKEPIYMDVLLGDSVYTGNKLAVKDSVYFDAFLKPTIKHTYFINNIISLRINESVDRVFPDSFVLNVKLKVRYATSETSSDSIQEKILTIDYFKNRQYHDKAIFLFNASHYVEAEILQITSSFADTSAIIPLVLLENRMVIERDYVVNCTNDGIDPVQLDTTTIASVGEIKIFWTPNQVSQMYDVEWTFIDKSALDNGRYNNIHGNLDQALIFKNNASRITTKADNCLIPLLYDGEGKLFYRVRGAQIDQFGEIQTTMWSSELDTLASHWSYFYIGHETELNWQASTSFAEEGKRKSVVQYFDGSLRARQVVTRDNTTMTTVVAETLYDKQGRPTIQILPAPTLNKIIGYTPLFNVRDMNSAEYDKGVYDTLFSTDDYCAAQADSFSVVSGAAQYYSEQNPLSGLGFHQFVAQDSGYVFTQTQYSQDNTGRIYRQSGVGKQYQLGTGRETKYYYGTPDQEHLDALFGTEAGYASHYQKNMVRDANGQYSVSYVDMHGRTVATALAGAAPTQLDTIASYRRDSLETIEMLSPISNMLNGNSIEFTKTILMTKRDSVWLNYSMGTEALTLKDCQDKNICYSCLYDLTISVTGECGSSVSGKNDTIIRIKNYAMWQVDTTCGIAQPISVTIPLILEEGSYKINKTLRISEEGRDKSRDSVFLLHNTCKTYEDFYQEQLHIAKDSMSCATDSVGTYLYLHYREQMMADLHPLTGQYGDTSQTRNCYSIFGKIILGVPKRWYHIVADTGIYRNEQGLPDSVINSAGQLVPPQQLTLDEFISNFKSSWALNLLSLHPEYCHLQKYEALAASHIWDEDFEKTHTYQAAVIKGYLNPTNSALVPASNFLGATDPLYSYSFGTTAKNQITDSLMKAMPLSPGNPPTSFATAWGLATAIAKCSDTLSAGGLWYWNQTSKVFQTNDLCTGELDMAWRIFRGIYLEKKREWIDNYIRAQCTAYSYPTVCRPVFPQKDSVLKSSGYVAAALGQNTSTGQAQADSTYAANCDAYKSWWRQQLGNCYTEAQKDVLVEQLAIVCKEGSDSKHPYGSSTVKPTSTLTPPLRSFETVVKFYNTLWGITDPTCNAYLIDKPVPYDKQGPSLNLEVWNKPDSCSCHKIDSFYNNYIQYYALDFPTFAAYLKFELKVDISASDADSLRKLCDGTIDCKFLPQSVTLPKELQCGYNLPSCIDCYKFRTANDSFRTKYPSIIPTVLSPDTLQQVKNKIYENFMNQWFGFNKQWYEFVQYQAYCELYTIRPTCDSLVKYWAEYFTNPVRPDPGCSGFLTYFNIRLGVEYTKPQIDSIYSNCGLTINWCDTIPLSTSQLTTIADQITCMWNSLEPPAVDTGACNISPWFFNNVEDGQITVYNTRAAVDTLIENGVFRNVHKPGVVVQAGRFKYNSRRGFKVPNEFAFEFRLSKNQLDQNGDPLIDSLQIAFDNSSTNQPGFGDENWRVVLSSIATGGNYYARGVTTHASEFNNLDFTNWHTYKMQLTHDSVKVFYDGNLLKGMPRDGNSYIYAAGGFDIIIRRDLSDSLKMDWFKLYGENGNLIFHEDFDRSPSLFRTQEDTNYYFPKPNCATFIKNTFNSLAGKSWTTQQIIYYVPMGSNNTAYIDVPCMWDQTELLCNDDSLTQTLNNEPCTDTVATAITAATQLYQIYKDSLISYFNEAYNKKCLSVGSQESFTITKPVSEYHYTLYYYDLAGNLIKTVPPEGVHPHRSSSFLSQVKTKRANGEELTPLHTLTTRYRYNSLNQVVSQQSPDGGKSEFWYDRLGRLVVSQNAKQRNEHNYSYTRYDVLGRIKEVGQKFNNPIDQVISRNEDQLKEWMEFRHFDVDYMPRQVTYTEYDLPSDFYSVYVGQTPFKQREHTLRNRVSYTRYYDLLDIKFTAAGTDTTYFPQYYYFNTGIEYSYDIHGNVDTMLNVAFAGTLMNSFGKNAYKYIAYKYDLISGKVNEVHYNAGFADEFYHRYEYDAENRLTDVYTTNHKALLYQTGLEEHDAHYQYYKHGPLARMVLGQQQVQGTDYAYTLQGWLKGVNSTSLNANYDMGWDGKSGSLVAKDVYSYQLNYNLADYKSINPNVRPFAGHYAAMNSNTAYRNLYNGNISSMAVNIGKFSQPQLYNYKYDQLNRLTQMDVYRGLDSSTNQWQGPLSLLSDYQERVSYDGNGNILKYKRNGLGSTPDMDKLVYNYEAGTNQLKYVYDSVAAGNYAEDIDNQTTNNYSYDAIGNLTSDAQAGINSISWNVYGKITNIAKASVPGEVGAIDYKYDPSGNRVGKTAYMYVHPDYNAKLNWYVRDAQGNVMAVYESYLRPGWSPDSLMLVEHHMYGSSRLGIIQRGQNMDSLKVNPINANLVGNTYLFQSTRGEKLYELSNHLGNVLVTISDKRYGVDDGNDGHYDYYLADVMNANDYYPFGMLMPGRKYSASDVYRYGFNGKENDNEVNGEGNQQDYGMRVYDPRIGRFLSVDPLTQSYPWYTPYQFAGNSPLFAVDLDGAEPKPSIQNENKVKLILQKYPNINKAVSSGGSNFKYGAWWRLAHGLGGTKKSGAIGIAGEGMAASGDAFPFYGIGAAPGAVSIKFPDMQPKDRKETSDFVTEYTPAVDHPMKLLAHWADGSERTVQMDFKKGNTYKIYYEVKTISEDRNSPYRIYQQIEDGINQVLNNINNTKSGTIHVLYIDKAAYMKVYNIESYKHKLNRLYARLEQDGGMSGYIVMKEDFYQRVLNTVNYILDEIKRSTDKTESGQNEQTNTSKDKKG